MVKKRKLRYHSNYYKQAFINNYEAYYQNGGRSTNKLNDEIYKQITGKSYNKNINPPKPRKTRKPSKPQKLPKN